MRNECILNVTKPVGILLVPLHSCFQSLLPIHLLFPPELVQLATVDRVPQIIELPIRHEGNQLFLLFLQSEDSNQPPSNVQIADFVIPPNVENHARISLVKDDLKRTCHVLDVQEVARVAPIPMQSHRATTQKLIGKLRDQLLGKLVRTVDVITPGDDAGELERSVVRFHEKLRPGLCGGVGVGGFQHVLLLHRLRFERFSLPVHFISGHVDESPNTLVTLRRLEHDVGSHDITLGKVERVTERVIDVRLRREVHDRIDLLLGHDVGYEVGTANVALDEFEVFEAGNIPEVGEAGAVVKFVVDDYLVMRVLFRQEDGRMRSNES